LLLELPSSSGFSSAKTHRLIAPQMAVEFCVNFFGT
jgi:hypothetical protein